MIMKDLKNYSLLLLIVLISTLAATAVNAQSQQTDTTTNTTITVGTKNAPPFAMLNEQGQWHGISIDLMKAIAEKLSVSLEFTETSLADLITGVADGRLDASIAAISITPDREQVIDFTHQYFGSGLAIVTPEHFQPGWKSMLKALISPQFLATIFLLCCVLSFVGVIIWMLESRRNSAQFGESPARGIGNGFWFAAVTMTTVGYGDKAPITLPGRVVSVVWMFAALILTAFLTAQLTTILTAQQAENVVTSIDDLPNARVGYLLNASSKRYFDENGITVRGYDSIESGFNAIANDKIDAFVHDQPLLRFMANQADQNFVVLPDLFDPQSYAIVVAHGFVQGGPHTPAFPTGSRKNMHLFHLLQTIIYETSNRFSRNLAQTKSREICVKTFFKRFETS